jgi:SRSO17 transposase
VYLVDEQQLLELKPELDLFLDRFVPLFGRDENQAHARRFVQGLLHGRERRNIENIAHSMQGGPVRSLQAFISTGAWSDLHVLAEMRLCVRQNLTPDDELDAVFNVDETDFPKKGTKSVGVKRQYCGTLGRTDNCQVAVFANYCSPKGHCFLDRRLFLPEQWACDPQRRLEAGVPTSVVFRTKPQLALAMLQDAVNAGTVFRWVGGDSVYGDSPTFLQGARALGKWYVVDTSSDAHVWAEEPKIVSAEQRNNDPDKRGGRPCTKDLVVGESKRVDEVIAALPESAYKKMSVGEGSQGARIYEYAYVWVWFSEEGKPGVKERLMVRRSLDQEPELKYHRSNAPAEVKLEKLVQVRGTRWTIEEDIKCGKGECGLDE